MFPKVPPKGSTELAGQPKTERIRDCRDFKFTAAVRVLTWAFVLLGEWVFVWLGNE